MSADCISNLFELLFVLPLNLTLLFIYTKNRLPVISFMQKKISSFSLVKLRDLMQMHFEKLVFQLPSAKQYISQALLLQVLLLLQHLLQQLYTAHFQNT